MILKPALAVVLTLYSYAALYHWFRTDLEYTFVKRLQPNLFSRIAYACSFPDEESADSFAAKHGVALEPFFETDEFLCRIYLVVPVSFVALKIARSRLEFALAEFNGRFTGYAVKQES